MAKSSSISRYTYDPLTGRRFAEGCSPEEAIKFCYSYVDENNEDLLKKNSIRKNTHSKRSGLLAWLKEYKWLIMMIIALLSLLVPFGIWFLNQKCSQKEQYSAPIVVQDTTQVAIQQKILEKETQQTRILQELKKQQKSHTNQNSMSINQPISDLDSSNVQIYNNFNIQVVNNNN